MARVLVEGIVGRILVSVEWKDGEVSGDPVVLKAIELAAGDAGRRFYEDPFAFAALASNVVEAYSDRPARVSTENIVAPLIEGIASVDNRSAA